MNDGADSIRRFFDGWQTHNARLVGAVRDLAPAQLALRPAPGHAPIWALAAHIAGAPVHWLCKGWAGPRSGLRSALRLRAAGCSARRRLRRAPDVRRIVERETGLEPATFSLEG